MHIIGLREETRVSGGNLRSTGRQDGSEARTQTCEANMLITKPHCSPRTYLVLSILLLGHALFSNYNPRNI